MSNTTATASKQKGTGAIRKQNIAYYRVSTKQQGISGLGLESQKALVFGYLRREPDFEFTEIESGRNDSRVEFSKALNKCKELNGRLVIAKLDRLSRDVHFISGLMKSGIDFICCDMPDATPFSLHIFAAVAEHEAKAIGERTKAALKAKIDREHALGNTSFRLGAPDGKSGFSPERIVIEGRMSFKEITEKRENAKKERYSKNPNNLMSSALIKEMHSNGKSVPRMMERLNELGFKAPQGGMFTKVQVYRILEKEGLKEKAVKVEYV